MVKRFALGWVISFAPSEDDLQAWVMVRNSQRGRELFEETGLLGKATHIQSDFFENGDLVRIVVDDEPSPIGWESSDHAIVEVGWCLEIPELQDWRESEIQRAIDHDWSVSEPLSSSS